MTSANRASITQSKERYLAVSAVAKLFGVTEVTIKNWTNADRLAATRTAGGHRRIAASSVVALLEAQGLPVPRELADALPTVLFLASGGDPFLLACRRALGAHARIEQVDEPLAAAMAAVRTRPAVVVLDLARTGASARKLLDAFAVAEETRDAPILLVGDGTPPLRLLSTRGGTSSRSFHDRADRRAIAGLLAGMLRSQGAAAAARSAQGASSA